VCVCVVSVCVVLCHSKKSNDDKLTLESYVLSLILKKINDDKLTLESYVHVSLINIT
jgi:hypothetical protein